MPKQFVTNSTTTLINYRKRIFDPEPEYGQNVLKVKIWPDISVLNFSRFGAENATKGLHF